MIEQYVLAILSIVLVLACVTYLVRDEWFRYYLISLAFVIAIPIALVFLIVRLVIFLLRLLVGLSLTLINSVAKAVIITVVSFFAGFVYITTVGVPTIGQGLKKIDAHLENYVTFPKLVDAAHDGRLVMVEIVAESEDREPRFDSEEVYREKFVSVKEDGKQILSSGEGFLSLTIGALLLTSQVAGYDTFRGEYFGVTNSIIIQTWLILMGVMILYRLSILEFMAFDGDEEFSSLEEMDVAFSYQRALSQVGFFPFLNFVLVFSMSLVNADRKTFKKGLWLVYIDDVSLVEWMKRMFNEIREQKQSE